MSKVRLLTNVSQAEIVLTDMNGLIVSVGETVNGLAFSESTLISSTSVAQALLSKTCTT